MTRIARVRSQKLIFTNEIIIALALFYMLGFALVLLGAGPWEAARRFGAEGLILVLWFAVAYLMLRDVPIQAMPIKRPVLEMMVGVVSYVIVIVTAAVRYLGVPWLRIVGLVAYLLLLAIFIMLRYDRRAMGLANASWRAWMTALAIIAINLLVGIVGGQLLPQGEVAEPAGASLASGIQSPSDILILLGSLLIGAAIPEEFFFRVYLLPRLARYLPLGWAIVVQALLFSAAHLPQQILSLHSPWFFAVTALSINNGLIAGYLWSRTRSLPLLIVLHLFAYPRIGL